MTGFARLRCPETKQHRVDLTETRSGRGQRHGAAVPRRSYCGAEGILRNRARRSTPPAQQSRREAGAAAPQALPRRSYRVAEGILRNRARRSTPPAQQSRREAGAAAEQALPRRSYCIAEGILKYREIRSARVPRCIRMVRCPVAMGCAAGVRQGLHDARTTRRIECRRRYSDRPAWRPIAWDRYDAGGCDFHTEGTFLS